MLFSKIDRPGRRATLFVISLLIRTFGMALTIKAGLGASPSSSVPYAAYLANPGVSLAVYATAVSIIEVMIQKAIYRKYMSNLQMTVQIIISFLFGYALDAFNFLLSPLNPTDYVLQLFVAVLGCAVMAFGVYIELVANFTMLTGDGMNRAISYATNIKYGYVKMATDITLVLIAAAIGYFSVGYVEGVREGTLIAAVLVGLIVNVYNKRFTRLSEWLMPNNGAPNGNGNLSLSF